MSLSHEGSQPNTSRRERALARAHVAPDYWRGITRWEPGPNDIVDAYEAELAADLMTDEKIDAMFWPLGPSIMREESVRVIARRNVRRAFPDLFGEEPVIPEPTKRS